MAAYDAPGGLPFAFLAYRLRPTRKLANAAPPFLNLELYNVSVIARARILRDIFAIALTPHAAFAQSAEVGTLQCHLSGGVGMIIIENQALDCVFNDASGAPPSHYIGRLTNVGANIGISGPGQLIWTVVAATRISPPARSRAIMLARKAPWPSAPEREAPCLSAALTRPSPCNPFRCQWGPGSMFPPVSAMSASNICL